MKVVYLLGKAGFITTVRGRSGGMRLASDGSNMGGRCGPLDGKRSGAGRVPPRVRRRLPDLLLLPAEGRIVEGRVRVPHRAGRLQFSRAGRAQRYAHKSSRRACGMTAAPPLPFAEVRRAEIRSRAAAIGIDEVYISLLVETLYARIRVDEVGPIFERAVGDRWPPHLARLKRSWASVALSAEPIPVGRWRCINGSTVSRVGISGAGWTFSIRLWSKRRRAPTQSSTSCSGQIELPQACRSRCSTGFLKRTTNRPSSQR